MTKSNEDKKREKAEKKTASYKFQAKAAEIGIEAVKDLPTFFGELSYYSMRTSFSFFVSPGINRDLQDVTGMTQMLLPGIHFSYNERVAFKYFKKRTKLEDVK